MLTVFGTLALIAGILAGARPGVRPWIPAAAGALLLGVTVTPVLEFETDVPQFNEALYLPVLLAGALLAAVVLRLAVPGPLPVVRAVGIYALLRLVITVGLAALGRSTPDLPLAILGLAAIDLPWRWPSWRSRCWSPSWPSCSPSTGGRHGSAGPQASCCWPSPPWRSHPRGPPPTIPAKDAPSRRSR